jgi:4-hydroxybenzoate polyprenyltransferase
MTTSAYNDHPRTLSTLSSSLTPYIQLARLSHPAGLFLIYFPHVFGVLHAAIRTRAPPTTVLHANTVLFGGSFFVSNAGHIWNDLIDAELDSKVERTCNRPIPRGAVSPRAAFVFAVTQAAGAAWFLMYLPDADFQQGLLYTLPNVLAIVYYPWAKRHTYFPQVVLGFCLAWGTIMGELALGVRAFTLSSGSSLIPITTESSAIALFLAGVVWTVIYDTVYAHQDLQADLRVGIKSLAVLLQGRTKMALWFFLGIMGSLLVKCGRGSQFGPVYYLVGVGGSLVSLGMMVARVNLRDSRSCWWWFSNGFWLTGIAITAGLLGEYILQRWE